MVDYSIEIWKYLISNGCTKAGAAGILGNMKHESGVLPNRVEILCLKRIREYYGVSYDDASYTAAVDSGKITRERFLNPLPGKQYGYGLCQWTSPNRKAGFYDMCKNKGVSISDISCQLAWLLSELRNTYQSVWSVVSTSGDVATCTDTFLMKFEIPANASALKAQRRASAWEYYNKYQNVSTEASTKPQSGSNTSGGNSSAKPSGDSQGASQTPQQASSGSGAINKTPKFVGMVTEDEIQVRSWAGPDYTQIKSWPILKKTNLVDVCDTLTGSDGKPWYYIRIAGKIFGFVEVSSIKKQ